MKRLLTVICVSFLLSGCENAEPSGSAPTFPIIVNYRGDFSGDSVIIKHDQKVMLKDQAFAGGLNRPIGCLLASPAGLHTLSMELPLCGMQAGTALMVLAHYRMEIEANFDRTNKRIDYSVTYFPWR